MRRIRHHTDEGKHFPKVPADKNKKGATSVYLVMTFYMRDEDMSDFRGERGGEPFNSYRDLDLDNLLKPVLDALKAGKLVKDDRYFTGIKVLKQPAARQGDERVEIRCVSTYQFQIMRVQKREGAEFKPYWSNSVQFVTARNVQTEEEGCFMDNAPGCLFIDGREADFVDPIPGYAWKEGEVVDGCVVSRRVHCNAEWKGKGGRQDSEEEFVWLQKWAW